VLLAVLGLRIGAGDSRRTNDEVGHLALVEQAAEFAVGDGLARRNRGRLESRFAQPPDQVHGIGIDVGAPALQGLQEQLVLATAEAMHSISLRPVALLSLGDRDAARIEKAFDAVPARPPINVLAVVIRCEGSERVRLALGRAPEELVEELRPSRLVKDGCIGDDPIQVEDDRVEAVACDQRLVGNCLGCGLTQNHITSRCTSAPAVNARPPSASSDKRAGYPESSVRLDNRG
jgi:hypothetical protein